MRLRGDRPKAGDQLYFEIPAGIEQIESLKTETHLFLFDTLPSDPWQALTRALSSDARYTCTTLGVENKQGNREVVANWRIDETPGPVLTRVPCAFRPNTPAGKQQVRAEVKAPDIVAYEYLFEREGREWDPEFSADNTLLLPGDDNSSLPEKVELEEARGGYKTISSWKLVKGLVSREGSTRVRDEAALKLAAPDSGSFILVSLRRRRKDRIRQHER